MPCLNNGTCINVILNKTRNDLMSALFECKCPRNFYGEFCELRVDICQNRTCSSDGRCVDRNGEAKCECFVDYFGDNCEHVGKFQTVRKSIQMSSVLILVGSIGTLTLLVVVDDILTCLGVRSRLRVRKRQFHYIPYDDDDHNLTYNRMDSGRVVRFKYIHSNTN